MEATTGRRALAWVISTALTLLVALVSGTRGDDPPARLGPVASRPASVGDPPASLETVAKKKEHCSVDASLLEAIGSARGRQVRVSRGDADFALFTVVDAGPGTSSPAVRIGRLGRLRLGSTTPFDGRIGPALPASDLTDEAARARGELVERLDDDGTNAGLLILAPHGGQIETPTDLQAERVATKLRSGRVTTWRCRGYHPAGSKAAFERWHITSTEISEASYPLLARVAARKFEHAVSFHGMVEDRVLIGGAAPSRLKVEVRDAIRTALRGTGIAVDVALPGDANGGRDPRNIVNRYVAAGGVQIEQSPRAREHWEEIADAVARVYASKL